MTSLQVWLLCIYLFIGLLGHLILLTQPKYDGRLWQMLLFWPSIVFIRAFILFLERVTKALRGGSHRDS